MPIRLHLLLSLNFKRRSVIFSEANTHVQFNFTLFDYGLGHLGSVPKQEVLAFFIVHKFVCFHCIMQVKFCAAERSVAPPASEMWHSQIFTPKCLWYNMLLTVLYLLRSRYGHTSC